MAVQLGAVLSGIAGRGTKQYGHAIVDLRAVKHKPPINKLAGLHWRCASRLKQGLQSRLSLRAADANDGYAANTLRRGQRENGILLQKDSSSL